MQATMGAERLGLGKLPLRKLHICEVSTWESTLGKLQIGNMHLGKYVTSYLMVIPKIRKSSDLEGFE